MSARNSSLIASDSAPALRVAWFSTLDSSRMLKSVFFTRTVLPFFTHWSNFEIELFVSDSETETSASPAGIAPAPTFPIAAAFQRHREQPFDLFFYQLEDSPLLSLVRRHHALWPGLTLFHDLNLNTLHLEQFRANTGAVDLNREMDRLFGTSSARLGDYHVRGWPLEAFDAVYPAGWESINSSAAILVGSASEQYALASRGTMAGICPLPVAPVEASRVAAERIALRRMIDLPENAPIIGYSGGTRLRERAPQLLEAFERLVTDRGPAKAPVLLWLVAPGADPKQVQAFLSRQIASESVLGRIALVTASSEAEFAAFHSIADLFASPGADPLRSQPLGLCFAIARGLPCVVSNTAAPELVAQHAALGISSGRGEALALMRSFAYLLENPGAAEQIGETARTFAATQHSPELVAKGLAAAFMSFAPASRSALAAQSNRYTEERERLLGHGPAASELFSADCVRAANSVRAAKDFGWQLSRSTTR